MTYPNGQPLLCLGQYTDQAWSHDPLSAHTSLSKPKSMTDFELQFCVRFRGISPGQTLHISTGNRGQEMLLSKRGIAMNVYREFRSHLPTDQLIHPQPLIHSFDSRQVGGGGGGGQKLANSILFLAMILVHAIIPTPDSSTIKLTEFGPCTAFVGWADSAIIVSYACHIRLTLFGYGHSKQKNTITWWLFDGKYFATYQTSRCAGWKGSHFGPNLFYLTELIG